MHQTVDHEPWWTRHAALLIAGGYCLLSLIYITTSDRIVLTLLQEPERITFVQSVKGQAFVIVSAVLLFAALHVALTRVRRAREAQQAANEQYRGMIETTNEGVWILNEEGVTTFVNPTMAEMLQQSPEEIVGRPHVIFLDEEWHDFAIDQFERRKEGLRDQYECEFTCGDGKSKWFLISASPLYHADGTFSGSLRMVTDITKLKNTEQALKSSLNSQRQLLNELDHRVRNNLSSLISLVDISRGGASDVAGFAQSIRGRIDAMNRAYVLLSTSGWKQQDFHRLLYTLIPGELSNRIEPAGPHVQFAPYLSGAVAIVMHELLTNAMRHGALSNETGRVGITWRVTESDDRATLIELRWTEGGGPPIVAAQSSGTGLQLIKGLVRSDLRGDVEFEFPPDGARHVVRMRLEEAETPTMDDLEDQDEDAEAPTDNGTRTYTPSY